MSDIILNCMWMPWCGNYDKFDDCYEPAKYTVTVNRLLCDLGWDFYELCVHHTAQVRLEAPGFIRKIEPIDETIVS